MIPAEQEGLLPILAWTSGLEENLSGKGIRPSPARLPDHAESMMTGVEKGFSSFQIGVDPTDQPHAALVAQRQSAPRTHDDSTRMKVIHPFLASSKTGMPKTDGQIRSRQSRSDLFQGLKSRPVSLQQIAAAAGALIGKAFSFPAGWAEKTGPAESVWSAASTTG
jgi:hypothetical protein